MHKFFDTNVAHQNAHVHKSTIALYSTCRVDTCFNKLLENGKWRRNIFFRKIHEVIQALHRKYRFRAFDKCSVVFQLLVNYWFHSSAIYIKITQIWWQFLSNTIKITTSKSFCMQFWSENKEDKIFFLHQKRDDCRDACGGRGWIVGTSLFIKGAISMVHSNASI